MLERLSGRPTAALSDFSRTENSRRYPRSAGRQRNSARARDSGVEARGTDGNILFASETGPMRRVSSNGGPCVEVLTKKANWGSDSRNSCPTANISFIQGNSWATPARAESTRRLRGSAARWTRWQEGARGSVERHLHRKRRIEGGHLLFVRARILMAVRFDPATMQPTVIRFRWPTRHHSPITSPEIGASVAKNGTIVYIANSAAPFEAEWTDRTGKQRSQIDLPGDSRGVALSPNGRQATVNRRTGGGIHLYDLDRNSEVRLTVATTSGTGVWFRKRDANRLRRHHRRRRRDLPQGGKWKREGRAVGGNS